MNKKTKKIALGWDKGSPEKSCPKKIGDIFLWKIGNNDRPATKEDLKDFAKNIEDTLGGKNLNLISHHAVEVETIQSEMFEQYIIAWKIGNDDFPATQKDIDNLSKNVSKAYRIINSGENAHMICNHTIRVEYVYKNKMKPKVIVCGAFE
jgi:hypothetical protein